jgi:hypothetical protein
MSASPQPPNPATPGPQPKLLDRARSAIRVRHYSRRTEEAYAAWIRRFIFFHRKRHPQEMGTEEINAFLSHLAVEGKAHLERVGEQHARELARGRGQVRLRTATTASWARFTSFRTLRYRGKR